MNNGRCAAHCGCSMNRRRFLAASAASAAGLVILGGCQDELMRSDGIDRVMPCGPASTYTPTIKAAFVRRQEEYGMWWPGAVYDGQAARATYTEAITQTGHRLGAAVDLRSEPIYSLSLIHI